MKAIQQSREADTGPVEVGAGLGAIKTASSGLAGRRFIEDGVAGLFAERADAKMRHTRLGKKQHRPSIKKRGERSCSNRNAGFQNPTEKKESPAGAGAGPPGGWYRTRPPRSSTSPSSRTGAGARAQGANRPGGAR